MIKKRSSNAQQLSSQELAKILMGEDGTQSAHMTDDGCEPERKSRSQKKRDSTALQKAGESLAALSLAEWKRLNLSEDLIEALTEWQGMKTHEAKRRQMQYIGRLMREEQEKNSV